MVRVLRFHSHRSTSHVGRLKKGPRARLVVITNRTSQRLSDVRRFEHTHTQLISFKSVRSSFRRSWVTYAHVPTVLYDRMGIILYYIIRRHFKWRVLGIESRCAQGMRTGDPSYRSTDLRTSGQRVPLRPADSARES